MVTALTDGDARVFPAEQLRRFLVEHPAVLWSVAAGLCERLIGAEARIASVARDNADCRLARLLCDLERHGDADYDGPVPGTQIPLKLSQTELASWIGSSRATVDRTLARWRSRGIISTRYRTIVVHDLETLARIAGIQIIRRAWNWPNTASLA
jgi:CRP-like cAMP-binding protein